MDQPKIYMTNDYISHLIKSFVKDVIIISDLQINEVLNNKDATLLHIVNSLNKDHINLTKEYQCQLHVFDIENDKSVIGSWKKTLKNIVSDQTLLNTLTTEISSRDKYIDSYIQHRANGIVLDNYDKYQLIIDVNNIIKHNMHNTYTQLDDSSS